MSMAEYRDAEGLSFALRHADVAAMQLNRGRFHASLQARRTGDWSIQQVAFLEGSATCSGSASRDRHMFVVPVTVQSGCRLLGKEINRSSIGHYAPGSEHADVSMAAFTEFVLTPPTAVLEGALERGEQIRLLSSGSQCRAAPVRALDELRLVLQELSSTPLECLAHPEIIRSMNASLEATLIAAITPKIDQAAAGRTPLPRMVVLKQVAEYLNERDGEVAHTSEIAAAVGVSHPTLQRIFLEWYGVPPARYLNLKRIYLARRRLSSGQYNSVSEVATSCGFWELSRFASRYKAVFNELPSRALVRRDDLGGYRR